MFDTYRPQGNTTLIAATTTASAAIQPSTGSIGGCRIVTVSTGPVYAAFGATTATAVLPTTSTPAEGMPIQANSVETFSLGPNFWASFITTGGTAQVYVTPGFGS
jgi:hypothetical protein